MAAICPGVRVTLFPLPRYLNQLAGLQRGKWRGAFHLLVFTDVRSFVVAKKEKLIVLDRTADIAAKGVANVLPGNIRQA